MFRNAISTLLVIPSSLAAPHVMAADSCQHIFDALTKDSERQLHDQYRR